MDFNKGLICIVAYNRWLPLRKLMSDIKDSDITDFDIVISIDHSDKQDDICKKIEDSNLLPKVKIIRHKNNIGLKRNVLFCGDLVKDYNFVVVLEDDLRISPFIKNYIDSCLKSSLDRIASISLYSYRRSEGDLLNFFPKVGCSDVYFMQFPSSWGQIYTKSMWFEFRKWLDKNDCDYFQDSEVPKYVCNWPSTSWKKHFIRYMIKYDKFSIYPYFSMTTNLGEDGTHHRNVGKLWNASLLVNDRAWNVESFNKKSVKYNSHFLQGSNIKKYTKSEIREQWRSELPFVHIDYAWFLLVEIISYIKRKLNND